MSEIDEEEKKPKLLMRRSLIWEKSENEELASDYVAKKKKTLSFKNDRKSESPQNDENDLEAMRRTSQKIKDYYFKSNDYI